MNIFQVSSLASLLLLTTAALAFVNGSASAAALENQPSGSAPSSQLISQTSGLLRLGERGDAVVQLQQNLTTLGYFSGVATGYFGSATEDAVMRFQRDAGLVADGVVGSGTDEAIRQKIGSSPAAAPAATPASKALRLNDTGTPVSELQSRMTDLGYFSGPVTGFFGSQTEAAVINFQRANGLPADGVYGASTADAMRRAGSGSSGAPTVRPPVTSGAVLRRGDTGTQVVDLQTRLRQLRFFSGPVTGNFGPITEDAVKAFQRSQGLLEDGIAGPAVNSALARLTTS